jgi:DNA-binding transcriptional regulator of glucitol operon
MDMPDLSNEDAFDFAPLMPDGTRALMSISAADLDQMPKGQFWLALVTDVKTGRHYEVESAECSFPGCVCEAKVLREAPSREQSVDFQRRSLEIRHAGLAIRIADLESNTAAVIRQRAVREVTGTEEDLTHLVVDMNKFATEQMTSEQREIEEALSKLTSKPTLQGDGSAHSSSTGGSP